MQINWKMLLLFSLINQVIVQGCTDFPVYVYSEWRLYLCMVVHAVVMFQFIRFQLKNTFLKNIK